MARFQRLLASDFVRYFIASLIALAVDTATLSISLRLLHMRLSWSATAGFVLGAFVAYVLSIRWVFRDRALRKTPALEALIFVGIGVAGLGVTQLVLWLGVTQLRLMPEAVKLAAAVVTFAFNFLVRKTMLFAVARRTQRPLESST